MLIAMIEYLRSGESKLGHLNNSVAGGLLHKDNEVKLGESLTVEPGSGDIRRGKVRNVGDPAVGLRRSTRKRKAEMTEDVCAKVKSRKR